MPFLTTPLRLSLATLVCALATACASVAHTAATLNPPAQDAAATVLTLGAPAKVEFDTHYSRQLAAGSQWKLVGSLPQGQVFRPVNDVFTVEGANMHEAYLVIANGRLVGFYLPAESGFSSLAQQPALHFN